MALPQFAHPPLTTMVEDLRAAPALTLVVGAGVSAEAGLPSWKGLLRHLLDRAAIERLDLTDAAVRDLWVDEILGSESPLGAAAVAEALAGADLPEWIFPALYDDEPTAYQPGPIARQVVELRRAFGRDLAILTTNYDDLLEQAFADSDLGVAGSPFARPSRGRPAATDVRHQRIVHLHGFLPRAGARQGAIVLSEDDYQQVAQDDWQSAEVGHALMSAPCLFLGSSLTDPNLLRYLYRHARGSNIQHYAIFTRQDTYARGTPPELIAARERALAERWRQSKVEIVFVDHYAEIAQALTEVALARSAGADAYVPLPDRLNAWHAVVARELLAADDPAAFPAAQDLLHQNLRDTLATATETALGGAGAGDEVLGATLWLVDATGTTLTSWATTDRVHRDARTVAPIAIDEFSAWVAVRAFTRGAALGEPRDVYASRWRYIRGLPLVTADRIPVGVITVSSMRSADETILKAMPNAVAAVFDRALQEAALDILDLAFPDR